MSKLIQSLGVRLLTQDRDLLQRHAEMITNSLHTQQALIDLILATRTRSTTDSQDNKVLVAASNAISILNFGAVGQILSFRFDQVQDWSRIRVPHANLNSAQILNCNFADADLSNGTLVRAVLHGSNFQGSNLLNAYTGQSGPLLGHENIVSKVVFTPDGRYIISLAYEKQIRFWDVKSRACVTALKCDNTPGYMALSHDGKLLAACDVIGGVRVWDIESKTEVGFFKARGMGCVAFSPDSSLLAAGSFDCLVRVWNIVSKECVLDFTTDSRPVELGFSPDGVVLAVGLEDYRIHLWNLDVDDFVETLEGSQARLSSITFSPDGRLLVATARRNIYVWNLESKHLASLENAEGDITFARFSHDGTLLASGCRGNLQLWDVVSCQNVSVFDANGRAVGDVFFDPNGELVAAGWCDREVHIWDVRFTPCAGSVIRAYPSSAATSMAFHPDGRLVALGDQSGAIAIWSIVSKRRVSVLKLHTARVESVCFSSHGKLLASASQDGTIRLWSASATATDSYEPITTLEAGIKPAQALCFSPDDTLLASGGLKDILLWSVESHTCLAKIEDPKSHAMDLCFSPDGRRLAGVYQAFTVKIWDVQSRKCEGDLKPNFPWVSSLHFSPDSRHVVVSAASDIHLWDVETMQSIAQFESGDTHNRCVRFSPDGKLIAVASQDQQIRLWQSDTTPPQLIATLQGHTGHVISCAFSSDSRLLVSASTDGSLRIWRCSGSSWTLQDVFGSTYQANFSTSCFDQARVNEKMLALCGKSAELAGQCEAIDTNW